MAALLIPAGGLVFMATPAQAAEEATATFTRTADWGTGFEGKWTIKNTGDTTLNSWELEWDFPSGTAVTSHWEAKVTKSGDHYTAVNLGWNGTIAPGASVSFGFGGTGSGAPSGCLINGKACDGSGGPDPTPTPTDPTPTPTDPNPTPTDPNPTPTPPGQHINLGYFTEWGVYGRDYHVKDLVTSGAAEKLTHINYSFGNVQGGKCTMGDSYAAIDKAYTAAGSVDGKADTWDQPLRGNFNQLLKLKKAYPHIKILWSFGGWTWSGGFGDAMKNPAAFASSCHDLVYDPRWAGLFDGIDLDWEYPNACGLSCDNSGPDSMRKMMQAFRAKFGQDQLVTAAITADASSGGKIDKADYAGAAQYTDWYNVMTYDFFGAWNKTGPTAPHSPLTSYNGIPQEGFNSADAIAKLKAKGVPAKKLLLGIGFYGRGWTGVTQAEPGGTATGAAPGTYEAGIEDYKVLKQRCPATGTIAGTAYAKCGDQWWSYDTPSTIKGKMNWAKQQGLGGAFFWETSGDTANGELVTAIHQGLNG
ncbi:glycosyl hydrolase family 18 protein [Streptomyces chumphonensis]|uniref:chitinase n=1 Tax=Streptomyces chumphonensis TaxID=1214925 RepID=A0A927F2V2_9ACTN|nr:glycosyl hydrolase family 18 protein [Streptomyces chumphonensis]MBD3934193.1 cellulose binding domain-containing protein [Streptomyces chumphonensis]